MKLQRRGDERGSALIMVLLFGTFLVGLSAVALSTATDETRRSRGEWDLFHARQNAMSGVSEALARIRAGGQTAPASGVPAGTTGTPVWVSAGPTGGFYYSTLYDASNSMYTITSYGRHQTAAGAQAQTALSPVDPTFDRTGWMIRGVEVIVVGQKDIPNAPLYFGNGGVEKGRGGWAWNSGNDPLDTSSWTSFYGVNGSSPSGVQSFQSKALPFRVSALDHPATWLDATGGYALGPVAPGDPGPDGVAGTADDGPDVAQTPHPYSLFAGQTLVGAYNADRWFNEWTDSGTYDPASVSQPNIDDTSVYPNNDPTGTTIDGDPFPVDTTIPDVQTWSWDMWEGHKNAATTIHLQAQNASGEMAVINKPDGTACDTSLYTLDTSTNELILGSPTQPVVVFITGKLGVPSDYKVKGYGVFVMRDDFHPDEPNPSYSEPNQPQGGSLGDEVQADIRGDFEWTGLAMIAGWRPNISTQNMATGRGVRILGAFFGEDSVQSGGEQSLDTAQIQLYVGPSRTDTSGRGSFEVFYCREIFEPGGLIYNLLPEVSRVIVSIRELE